MVEVVDWPRSCPRFGIDGESTAVLSRVLGTRAVGFPDGHAAKRGTRPADFGGEELEEDLGNVLNAGIHPGSVVEFCCVQIQVLVIEAVHDYAIANLFESGHIETGGQTLRL